MTIVLLVSMKILWSIFYFEVEVNKYNRFSFLKLPAMHFFTICKITFHFPQGENASWTTQKGACRFKATTFRPTLTCLCKLYCYARFVPQPVTKDAFNERIKTCCHNLTVQWKRNAKLTLQADFNGERETYFSWLIIIYPFSFFLNALEVSELQLDSCFHIPIGLFLSKKYLYTFPWVISHKGWYR